jgi:effector-binding domain-containing protein
VLDRLREDYDLYERTLSELKNKLKKDDNFIKGSVKYLL